MSAKLNHPFSSSVFRRLHLCLTVLCVLVSACQQTPIEPPIEPPEKVGQFQATGTLSTDHYDIANAVAVSKQGDVFVAGVQAYDAVSPYGVGRGEQLRGFLNHYSAFGKELVWQTIINFPCPKRFRSEEAADLCAARVADLEVAESDLYIAVEAVSRGEVDTGRANAYTFKYNGNGDLLWQKALTSATASRPLGLAAASDNSTYVLWQEYSSTPDGSIRGKVAGVYLGKLSASGKGEWFIELNSAPSYEMEGSDSSYREVADVTILGETVIVASLSAVQAFSATGDLLWQTPLDDVPTDTAIPGVGERFFTRAEVVAGGDRVYVSRSSLEYRGDQPSVASRLDLTALKGTGEVFWRMALGDETADISDTRLAVDEFGRLQVTGTSQKGLGEPSNPFNFLDIYSAQGSLDTRRQLGALGSITDFSIEDSADAAYLVGVVDVEEQAGAKSTDAFLSVYSSDGIQTQK